MDTNHSFLDKNEAVQHINMLAVSIADFIDNPNPSKMDVVDFTDNVAYLAAILKTLEFTTIQDDYFEILKDAHLAQR